MPIRRKRSDTKLATIERQYGIDLGLPAHMTLGEALARTGHSSLTKLVGAAKAAAKTWQEAERAACRRRGMLHVGGPGAPDCDGGNSVVEVKHQRRPVSRSQILGVVAKPWARGKAVEFVSASEFDDGARAVADLLGVKLSRR